MTKGARPMKCSYHPPVDATEFCGACSRPLCPECAHQIKSKIYCQDCLVRAPAQSLAVERSSMAWGVFLMVLGVIFLLQRMIPYHFISRLWPLLFIALGVYLVYRTLQEREPARTPRSGDVLSERKEF